MIVAYTNDSSTGCFVWYSRHSSLIIPSLFGLLRNQISLTKAKSCCVSARSNSEALEARSKHHIAVLGVFVMPFAIYEAVLASRVIRIRRTNRISLDTKMRTPPADGKTIDPLTVATRAHANFVEGVPLALVIAGVAELNGAKQSYLGLSLLILLIGRLLHVEIGLLRNAHAAGVGRTIGTSVTQLFIVVWGAASAYLALTKRAS